jgi:hypothetical protein
MRLKSAEHRQEKGEHDPAGHDTWVGKFPCRGQEAPQSALIELSKISRRPSRSRRSVNLGHGSEAQTVFAMPLSNLEDIISTTGKRMRTRAFVLSFILPTALTLAPSLAHGQRYVYRDCGDRYTWSPSRGCSYQADVAREARQAAERARAAAREDASRARAYASAARVDAMRLSRDISRQVSRDVERDVSRARFRADEMRDRMQERRDRDRLRAEERRDRYYRRW